MNKLLKITIALSVAGMMLGGCVPGEVKREARENRDLYESEFASAVESQLGPEYILSDVEGCITTYVSDYSILPEYSAESCLSGTIEHEGRLYDARYDFEAERLSSDVFNDEIVATCAEQMGIDRENIICGFVADLNRKRDVSSLFPVNIRDINGMMTAYRGKRNAVRIYIVTSMKTDDLDLEEFLKKYTYMKCEMEFLVFGSDEFTNEDHFTENYRYIQIAGDEHPEVGYGTNNEMTDVFMVYNLNGMVCIENGYDDKTGDYEVKRF